LTGQPQSVPGRFVAELIAGVRREDSHDAADVLAVVAEELPTEQFHLADVDKYYALCERAWLHWTRLALDFTTTLSLAQTSAGPFNPTRVRNAQQAGEAEVRCGLHWRLIDIAANSVHDPEWTWRIEAARQVHASTQKALRAAACIDPLDPPSVRELHAGIVCAADALAAAIVAGFVTDAAGEVRATVDAMLRGEGWGAAG